jgi:hypothetical protein
MMLTTMSSSSASNWTSKRKKGTAEDPINLDLDLNHDYDYDYSSPKRIKTCVPNPPFPTPTTTSSSSFFSSSNTSPVLYCISDSNSNSESESDPDLEDANLEYDSSHLDLNGLMHHLDRISRTKHMAILGNALQLKREQMVDFESVGESYQESYDAKTLEYQDKRIEYNELKTRGAPKQTLEVKRADLRLLKAEIEQDDEDIGNVQEAQRFYKQWVAALSDLRDTWSQLWDVYESMTNPGSSSAPAKASSLWGGGYGFQLQKALEEARVRAATAETEVAFFLTCLRASNDREVRAAPIHGVSR